MPGGRMEDQLHLPDLSISAFRGIASLQIRRRRSSHHSDRSQRCRQDHGPRSGTGLRLEVRPRGAVQRPHASRRTLLGHRRRWLSNRRPRCFRIVFRSAHCRQTPSRIAHLDSATSVEHKPGRLLQRRIKCLCLHDLCQNREGPVPSAYWQAFTAGVGRSCRCSSRIRDPRLEVGTLQIPIR